SIFNAVRRIRHTPESWKTSTTVLLHKKDQLDDVHNWRPIALSNTMGKLYASCVAWRLAEWCTENHRITNAQKGFMKFEGCLEHNFTVQSVIHMARQQSKEAAVAWLDFRNAFGSIWHTTIKKAL
uniref:Reverse transcriptase domain-containing protein n=1 Tax=Panagrellus redivivus TaxID=6233 RepID=A0A7E4ZYI0_PANRE